MPYVQYPAPVGGLNARDDLGNMRPEDAVVLKNWRPRPGFVQARKGQTEQLAGVIGEGSGRGTIKTFRSTFGDVLIFSGGDYLYGWDGDAGSSTLLYTGASGSRIGPETYWDSAHFQDKMIMTLGDGSNTAQVVSYDGTTISSTALNITTGPNEEDIRGVQVHKGRAYYWETASQSFWYAAAGAYQGDLTEFDLGTALKSGSALQMMLTLTVDGGGGQDDLACFLFGSGEVLVYQGDDPGDASAWELVGAFEIGQPVDPQAHAKIAGTELVYTRDGVIDLAAALKLGRFGESAEFTNKITNTATSAARDFFTNEGWQIIHAPGDNCLVLNIPIGVDPVTDQNDFKQYIRETDTGGWWECTGWNGTFAVFNDKLHIIVGGESRYRVLSCFEGDQDIDYLGISTDIDAISIPAFTAIRKPAQRKILTAVKPFTNIETQGAIKITGLANFDTTEPAATTTTTAAGTNRQPNISTFANGNFLTYGLAVSIDSSDDVKWNSTTLFYDNAGPV